MYVQRAPAPRRSAFFLGDVGSSHASGVVAAAAANRIISVDIEADLYAVLLTRKTHSDQRYGSGFGVDAFLMNESKAYFAFGGCVFCDVPRIPAGRRYRAAFKCSLSFYLLIKVAQRSSIWFLSSQKLKWIERERDRKLFFWGEGWQRSFGLTGLATKQHADLSSCEAMMADLFNSLFLQKSDIPHTHIHVR